jgi:hypothetical protein
MVEVFYIVNIVILSKLYECNNVVFLDVKPRGSCMNRRFGGKYRLHRQGKRISESETALPVISNYSTLQKVSVASYC